MSILGRKHNNRTAHSSGSRLQPLRCGRPSLRARRLRAPFLGFIVFIHPGGPFRRQSPFSFVLRFRIAGAARQGPAPRGAHLKRIGTGAAAQGGPPISRRGTAAASPHSAKAAARPSRTCGPARRCSSSPSSATRLSPNTNSSSSLSATVASEMARKCRARRDASAAAASISLARGRARFTIFFFFFLAASFSSAGRRRRSAARTRGAAAAARIASPESPEAEVPLSVHAAALVPAPLPIGSPPPRSAPREQGASPGRTGRHVTSFLCLISFLPFAHSVFHVTWRSLFRAQGESRASRDNELPSVEAQQRPLSLRRPLESKTTPSGATVPVRPASYRRTTPRPSMVSPRGGYGERGTPSSAEPNEGARGAGRRACAERRC